MNNTELVRNVVSIVGRDRQFCSGPTVSGLPRQAKVNAYGIRIAARQLTPSGNSMKFARRVRVGTTLIGVRMTNGDSRFCPDYKCGQTDRPSAEHLSESATWVR